MEHSYSSDKNATKAFIYSVLLYSITPKWIFNKVKIRAQEPLFQGQFMVKGFAQVQVQITSTGPLLLRNPLLLPPVIYGSPK